MGIISLYVAMVFLCLIPGGVSMDPVTPGTSDSKITQEMWEEAKTYAKQLCSEFAGRFKKIKENERTQFAVLTLDKINFHLLETEITHNKLSDFWPLSFIRGKNWVASYIAKVVIPDNRHLERILLGQLPDLFDKYYENNKNYPRNVYLYTYLIPCPDCTDLIKEEIENIHQNLQVLLTEEPTIDIHNMVFWVIYTNTGNPNAEEGDFKYTLDTFQQLSKNSKMPKFQNMRVGETLKDRTCVIE